MKKEEFYFEIDHDLDALQSYKENDNNLDLGLLTTLYVSLPHLIL